MLGIYKHLHIHHSIYSDHDYSDLTIQNPESFDTAESSCKRLYYWHNFHLLGSIVALLSLM